MNTRSKFQRIRRIWAVVGITVTIVFVVWSVWAYRATPNAKAAAESDSRVTVTHEEEGFMRFTLASATQRVPVGLVFFAGSLVDPVAYAPMARAIAAAGFPVILVPLPRRGAFGGADSPLLKQHTLDAIHADERANRWLIGGHSRGAVVATNFAADLQGFGAISLAGLVLVGTTHPRDIDMSGFRYPVTKIIGSNDGIAPEAKSEANRKLLPPHTTWVRIEGGNHSQFGWYGFQPFDHWATITRDEQQQQLVNAILAALREAGELPRFTIPAKP
jgi:pimeloyl-ACP methyl ester carboxylesterase